MDKTLIRDRFNDFSTGLRIDSQFYRDDGVTRHVLRFIIYSRGSHINLHSRTICVESVTGASHEERQSQALTSFNEQYRQQFGREPS
jgi:hypothetical protein